MRYPLIAFLLLSAALPACRRVHHPDPDLTIEEPSELTAEVNVNDPRSAAQLLSGFFNLEQNAWRWTGKDFSAAFAVPRDASRLGARLEADFVIPDAAASDLAGLTISAFIDGRSLPPFRSPGAGPQTAVFRIPPQMLPPGAVIVDFSLDKHIAPRANDDRILGIIVSRFRILAASPK